MSVFVCLPNCAGVQCSCLAVFQRHWSFAQLNQCKRLDRTRNDFDCCLQHRVHRSRWISSDRGRRTHLPPRKSSSWLYYIIASSSRILVYLYSSKHAQTGRHTHTHTHSLSLSLSLLLSHLCFCTQPHNLYLSLSLYSYVDGWKWERQFRKFIELEWANFGAL